MCGWLTGSSRASTRMASMSAWSFPRRRGRRSRCGRHRRRRRSSGCWPGGADGPLEVAEAPFGLGLAPSSLASSSASPLSPAATDGIEREGSVGWKASLSVSPTSVASRRRCLEMRELPTEGTTGVLSARRGCPTEGSPADSCAYVGALESRGEGRASLRARVGERSRPAPALPVPRPPPPPGPPRP